MGHGSWSLRRHLAVAFVVGLALRVVFTIVTKGDAHPSVDGPWYTGVAEMLDQGRGVVFPWIADRWGGDYQTAQHPPLFALYLWVAHQVIPATTLNLRLCAALLGSTGILVGGGLGNDVGGRRVGIALGWLVALNPLVWINDAEVQSESAYIPIVLGTIWAAYRLHRSPSVRHACVLGAMLGISILTRSEAAILCLLLALPVVADLGRLSWRRRAELLVSCAAVVILLVAPLVAYNLERFDTRVWLSTSAGGVIPQANCDDTFYGEAIGYTSFGCWFTREELPLGPNETVTDLTIDADTCRCDPEDWACIEQLCMMGDEGRYANYGTHVGLAYINAHRDRLPYVVSVRFLRLWELYRPMQLAAWNVEIDSRNRAATHAGLAWFYLSAPVWISGLVLMRRRGLTLLPVTAYAVSVTLAALVAGTVTRYRLSFDLAVLLPMAIAIVAVLDRRRAVQGVETA